MALRLEARCWTARLATLLISLALIAAACGGDDDSGDPAITGTDSRTTTTEPEAGETGDMAETDAVAPSTTEAPIETLRVSVSNDDGVAAEGISAVVEGLAALPNVEVTVSAPAENQSGTSDTTTDGDVVSTEATTADGHPATAVEGFPADAVLAGLEAMGIAEPPHLVVSGINEGPNIGQLVELSGTVGAARTGARAGIPALAVSQGLGEPIEYETATLIVVDWVDEHRDALVAGEVDPLVVNYNVPTCPVGEVRGIVEVPLAGDAGDRDLTDVDCEGDVPEPADDLDALIFGWASETDLTF